MGILEAKAEAERKTFIKNCIGFDTPRLESETYPDGLDNEFDLEYSAGLTLDIYTPQAAREGHAFLLVHGGAFVYGHKELDKCFGMHLALKSGIRVVNINYTLMPDNDLHGLLSQIMKAVRFIQERLHIEHIHTVGDSAGGYLALISALASRNSHIAHDLWIFEKLKGQVAALSIAAAEKIVSKNIDAAENEALIKEFIDQLDKDKIGDLPC